MNIKPLVEEPPADPSEAEAEAAAGAGANVGAFAAPLLPAADDGSNRAGAMAPVVVTDVDADAMAAAQARAQPLSARLRDATADAHRSAEETPYMRALTGGRVAHATYCLLLRNLYALYATLERALDRHAEMPQLAPLHRPDLFRAEALKGDLAFLRGADWPFLPLTATMRSYVARLESLDRDRPALLVAHAYVRYLGDLSGGQMLDRVVRGALGLSGEDGARFYAFGDEGQVGAARKSLREALDALPLEAEEADAVVDEAGRAFERHIALFEELEATLALK